jgi:orotate phosphoribosyltransferase
MWPGWGGDAGSARCPVLLWCRCGSNGDSVFPAYRIFPIPGSKLKDGDRVVMIEDVTTSGKSMEETVPKVRSAADVEIVGLMVSLNRMEVGKGGEKSALDEIQEEYGFKANAIVSMADVVEYLYNKECNGKVVIDDTIKTAIDEYYKQYGAK